ncbi:MAG TPA: hypothetical protein PK264_18190, partial [Hyphomicrobiaceae bacterium]|nr:hypothetical protein [Hyphomicrobiaceae bacterium]
MARPGAAADAPGIPGISLATVSADDFDRLTELATGVDAAVISVEGSSARQALAILNALGVRRVVLQGGGAEAIAALAEHARAGLGMSV